MPWAAFDSRDDATDDVVGRFDGQAWTADDAANTLPGAVQALASDERGLWAATRAGVARFDDGRWHPFVTDDGPASNALASVAVRDDTVWVGTRQKRPAPAGPSFVSRGRSKAAVSRFDGQGWTTWTLGDAIPDSSVAALAAGPDGTVWAAMGGAVPGAGDADVGGVARFDGTAWTTADGFDHDHAQTITMADDDTVWEIVIDVLGMIDRSRRHRRRGPIGPPQRARVATTPHAPR